MAGGLHKILSKKRFFWIFFQERMGRWLQVTGLHKILSKKDWFSFFFEERREWTADSGSFFEFVFFEERMGRGLKVEN
jgi:hypothetical protein